ncbi:CHAP domain-containing protein [Lactococcus lactis]|uniref:CHAP domain-containing protein n=1 Tax=Lactococcus lactis TaxID=1358 RepID=A0AAE4NN52_9LACT|nr:CHAP domain-containing protein [Lactococcus lactis]MDV2631360.1 CHAP domain-containing protein [Lactococcus lactis]
MPTDNRTKMERHLKSDKKQVFYRIERDGIKKAAHNGSKGVAFSDKYKKGFQKQKSKNEKASTHFKSKSKTNSQSDKESIPNGFTSQSTHAFGSKKALSKPSQKHSGGEVAKVSKKQGKKIFTQPLIQQLDENESTEGVKNLKKAQDNVQSTYKTTKKVKGFLTKHEKFGRSVNSQTKQDFRFHTNNTPKKSKIEKGLNSNPFIKPNSSASLGKSLVQKITNSIQKVAVAVMNKPTAMIGGAVVVVGVLFLGLISIFFPAIMNSNNQQAETYGVTYVKHWSEDGDAYHSDYLAQRYGITAEQIDGFIKSQGFTGLDSRASGTEFLKLQSESNIDVRMLVAFAQMESSYGTAGVAADYPKSNLFGYGAVDNDPDQGASWDNDRAVTDFKATQYDKYSNTSLYIMDLRAAAYHSGALKPGEAVYWTAIDSGKQRAKVAEAFDKYIDEHGGTPAPPNGYGPVDGGGGSANVEVLNKMLGQIIPGDFGGLTGQCYAVSAYYAHSINSNIILRGGVAASDIGSDYDWKGWGWTVVNEPKYSQIKVGDIINFKRGANMGTWNTDAENGHTAVVGKILGKNEIMIYDQNPTPLKTWTYTYNSGVASVIHPPKK